MIEAMADIKVKWSELLIAEFKERMDALPVVYLPLGLCEPHGHIAALGLDTLKAEWLCEEAAKCWGGIVAPTQGYQIHETGFHAPWLAEVVGNTTPFMTSMPAAPLLYFFLYQLRAFYNAGFQCAIVISGHAGGNQKDFRMAADAFTQVSGMPVKVFTDPELTDGKYAGDHAGKYEISQLMYIHPSLVQMNNTDRWNKSITESRYAQGEDAGEATAAYGKNIMEDCLQGIHRIIEKLKYEKNNERSLMPYAVVEQLWRQLLTQQPQWVTSAVHPGQNPAPDNSVWKQYEQL